MKGKTRPGVDRITKQHLEASHAYAVMALASHLGHCIKCKRACRNVYARCDIWWHLAKQESKSARRLREYVHPETDNMTPMFTEAECDPPPF